MFSEQFVDELAEMVARKVVSIISAQSPMSGVQPRLMDTEQAAAYLGLPSASALRQRKCAGQVPDSCFVRMGGSVMYDRVALDGWIAEMKKAA